MHNKANRLALNRHAEITPASEPGLAMTIPMSRISH
jgi:hypothetical protein